MALEDEEVGGLTGDSLTDAGVQPNEEAVKKDKESDERAVKKMLDPRRPTKAEVEEHELFHLPYRNWCPVCVEAEGKEMDHRSPTDGPRGIRVLL